MNRFLHHKDSLHHIASELERALFNKYMGTAHPACPNHIFKYIEFQEAYKKCLVELDGPSTKNPNQDCLGQQQSRNAIGNPQTTSDSTKPNRTSNTEDREPYWTLD